MNTLSAHLKTLAPQGIALAFSGGTDSALLLHLLAAIRRESPYPLSAFFFRTPLQTQEEEQAARRMAEEEGVPFSALPFDPLQLPALRFNPRDRCYLCKRQLFLQLQKAARLQGLGILMDGTNADDLHTYRPGLRALRELGISSPLAELGISKQTVRTLAAQCGLDCAAKPSAPCLATRFEYGAELTPARLQQAADAERLLQQLYPGEPLRLRVHGELARLELPRHLLTRAAGQAAELCAALKPLGFRHITLDLQGFRSGSMDEP